MTTKKVACVVCGAKGAPLCGRACALAADGRVRRLRKRLDTLTGQLVEAEVRSREVEAAGRRPSWEPDPAARAQAIRAAITGFQGDELPLLRALAWWAEQRRAVGELQRLNLRRPR